MANRNPNFDRNKFLAGKPITVSVAGTNVLCSPKEFSTGSCGFSGTAKVVVETEAGPVTLQCSINPVVIGSKPDAK